MVSDILELIITLFIAITAITIAIPVIGICFLIGIKYWPILTIIFVLKLYYDSATNKKNQSDKRNLKVQ